MSKGKGLKEHVGSGSLSGIFGACLLQPLDLVKTRLAAAPIGTHRKYTNTIQTFRTVFAEEGIRGLWKGTTPSVIRIIPAAGLYFGSLHQFTQWLRGLFPERRHTTNLVAGAMARSVAICVLCPVGVVKTRMEDVRASEYKGTWDAFRSIYLKEGLAGLYSGLTPTLVRDVPYAAFQYAFYEYTKSFLTAYSPLHSSPIHFLSGFFSASFATLLTHPPDVIRTRLQIQRIATVTASSTLAPNLVYYTGVLDCLRKMFATEGGRVLFRGLMPRLLRRGLSGAIAWTSFEYFLTTLWTKPPL
eukprot:gnl/Hemi2/3567_TR1242_c0_g1_i1.p1 gnl/Hemi2/3567_TR1242_c0_g1~~gnl/Hemi2/3567_TR1242_c0_g1_i1.p1  ORF type:complete len:300 (-),score=-1.11 gnl/Hemi2/3567_TR1242_c0_g1_i1:77-976(-)